MATVAEGAPVYTARYLAYCAGESPAVVMARDVERYPGGKMCGFIAWIGARWREWYALNKNASQIFRTQADHDAFDAWLMSGSRGAA